MKQSFNANREQVNYVKQEPYVGDDGIYVPVEEYAIEGTMSLYRKVIPKELFIEAYNKWIRSAD